MIKHKPVTLSVPPGQPALYNQSTWQPQSAPQPAPPPLVPLHYSGTGTGTGTGPKPRGMTSPAMIAPVMMAPGVTPRKVLEPSMAAPKRPHMRSQMSKPEPRPQWTTVVRALDWPTWLALGVTFAASLFFATAHATLCANGRAGTEGRRATCSRAEMALFLLGVVLNNGNDVLGGLR